MKKTEYTTPIIVVYELFGSDVITTSIGADTPNVDNVPGTETPRVDTDMGIFAWETNE